MSSSLHENGIDKRERSSAKLTAEEIHRLATMPMPTLNIISPKVHGGSRLFNNSAHSLQDIQSRVEDLYVDYSKPKRK